MELFLAYGFVVIALLVSACFVWIRHPIHAALSFACAVLAAAGICLLQDASFVAASLVIVYAGATIIIFLFALMFAHQGKLAEYDLRMENPAIAAVASIGLLIALLTVANPQVTVANPQIASVGAAGGAENATAEANADNQTTISAAPPAKPKFADFGRVFYTRYLMAVELAGTLLLVATIGSVLIAQRDTEANNVTKVESK